MKVARNSTAAKNITGAKGAAATDTGSTSTQHAERAENIDRALMNLAEVRDLLEEMEAGENGGHAAEASAMFAKHALVASATVLEQALYDIGILKKKNTDYRPGGWFMAKFPSRKARAGEGAAGGDVAHGSQQ